MQPAEPFLAPCRVASRRARRIVEVGQVAEHDADGGLAAEVPCAVAEFDRPEVGQIAILEMHVQVADPLVDCNLHSHPFAASPYPLFSSVDHTVAAVYMQIFTSV